MDVYHTGKEDKDDHRIVRERLLDVAIPKPPEDGSVTRLEDCLEHYFNNKIEVKRHLQRRNTVQSFRSIDKGKIMQVETMELPPDSPKMSPIKNPPASRPTDTRRRTDSIFGQRRVENGEVSEKKTLDDISIGSNRQRAGTIRREVLMPAWQFFSLIRKSGRVTSMSFSLSLSSMVYPRSYEKPKDGRANCGSLANKEASSRHMPQEIFHDGRGSGHKVGYLH